MVLEHNESDRVRKIATEAFQAKVTEEAESNPNPDTNPDPNPSPNRNPKVAEEEESDRVRRVASEAIIFVERGSPTLTLTLTLNLNGGFDREDQ